MAERACSVCENMVCIPCLAVFDEFLLESWKLPGFVINNISFEKLHAKRNCAQNSLLSSRMLWKDCSALALEQLVCRWNLRSLEVAMKMSGSKESN